MFRIVSVSVMSKGDREESTATSSFIYAAKAGHCQI